MLDAVSRFISWIVMVPAAVVVVLFAVNNREVIGVDLWPLPFAASVPLFVIVLGALVIGFLVGATITWLSGGRARRRARDAEFRASHAERELHFLRGKLERLEEGTRDRGGKGGNLPATSSSGDRAA